MGKKNRNHALIYCSLFFAVFSFLFMGCFGPLGNTENNQTKVTVILGGYSAGHDHLSTSSQAGRAVCFTGDEGNSIEDNLDYTVSFTNTATNKAVQAAVIKSDGVVSASAVISPADWKIRVEARYTGTASPIPEAVPGEIYGLAVETHNIQESKTITIMMRRPVKVNFDADSGSSVAPQTVPNNGFIDKPVNPIKSDYTFAGWYKEANCINEWMFAYDTVDWTFSRTYTLYAKWEGINTDGSFIVQSPQDLLEVGRHTEDDATAYEGWTLSASYIQVSNINMSGEVWTPIGSSSDQFIGTYNGGSYTISNLTINNPGSDFQSLFGYIGEGGVVKDLGLTNCNIIGGDDTGGIAGRNEGTIQNCYVSGNVTGGAVSGSNNVGGIAGSSNGTVKNCFLSAGSKISGGTNTGGVVGWNGDGIVDGCYSTGAEITGIRESTGGVAGSNNGIVEGCYSTSKVTGTLSVGGVVGYNVNNINEVTVQKCYATGEVYGNDKVGGVVGTSDSYNKSIIQYCYFTGKVVNTGDSTGGVVGSFNGGIIQYCYSTGDVSGGEEVGGVVGFSGKGYADTGIVQNCYATGDVKGESEVGGVVGRNYDGSTIQNCYATGNVSNKDIYGRYVGGVAGENWMGKIINCVALNTSATLTSPHYNENNVGRIVGYIDGSGVESINNYAWSNLILTCTSGQSYVPDNTPGGKDGADITTTEAESQSWWTAAGRWDTTTGTAWNFNASGAWNPVSGKILPTLKGMPATHPQEPKLQTLDLGDGSAGNPFKVFDVATLQRVGKGTDNYMDWNLEAHYKQTAAIDMTGENWEPIGNYNYSSFTGTYDGGGFTISNLKNSATTLDDQGMFGFIGAGGVVKNLGLINCDIVGSHTVGGIAAHNSGTIQNCFISGDVTGSDYNIGGIAGDNNGTVQNCYIKFGSNIIGTGNLGGVVGYNNNGTVTGCYSTDAVITGTWTPVGGVVGNNTGIIEDCYSTCDVTGDQDVGGVLGSNTGDADGAIVQRCYATGEINGTGHVGGVVGSCDTNSGDSTVQYCYSTGKVVNSGDATGGVVGQAAGIVKNCYSTAEVSGGTTGAGGVVGFSRGTVQDCYATGDVSGNKKLGGVAGYTFGGAIIQNCYATGNVSNTDTNGEYNGGVIGDNWMSTLINCVALNNTVTLESSIYNYPEVGRIFGISDGDGAAVANNYARSDMVIAGNNGHTDDYGPGNKAGADVTTTDATTQSWWTQEGRWNITIGTAWNFNASGAWNPVSGEILPTLKGMPRAHVQVPKIQN